MLKGRLSLSINMVVHDPLSPNGLFMIFDYFNFLYDRKNCAVVLWYGAVIVVVGVVVGVCGQVGFRTITFVPVDRIF